MRFIAVMSDGRRIRRTEGVVDQAKQEGAQADQRIAFHLSQHHEQKTSANEGDPLDPLKTEAVGQPPADESAAYCAKTKDTHDQTSLTDAVTSRSEVDSHKRKDHRAAAVDQHDK